MSLLARLRQLGRENSIRLPPRPIAGADLQPGDWVEIGGEPWHVRGARPGERGLVLQLTGARDPTLRAELVVPEAPGEAWLLLGSLGPVEVPPEAVTAFPAGLEALRGS